MSDLIDVIEKRTYRLTPITPILIQGGDGSADYGQSFVRSPNDHNFIYLVDQNKFRQYLYQKGGLGLIEKFVSWLNNINKRTGSGLTEFLQNINFNFDDIKEISKGKVYARQKKRSDYFFIRNGMNKAYIPGSSIKGVIKTAVLWRILKSLKEKNPELFEENVIKLIDSGIRRYEKEYNQKQKNKLKEKFSFSIIYNIFQAFILKSDTVNENHFIEDNIPFIEDNIPSPVTDLFRVIKVKDSTIIDDEFIYNQEWNLLTLNRENNPYFKLQKNFNLEVFFNYANHPNCFVDFEIILDKHLFRNFKNSMRKNSFWSKYEDIPFSNINELMEILNEFSSEIWLFLENFYKQIRPKTPNNKNIIFNFYKMNNYRSLKKMKIGWGSGLLGTTFALLLQDSPNLKNKLIQLRDEVISKDGKLHGEFVPKSTRVVFNPCDKSIYPLGWATFSEV